MNDYSTLPQITTLKEFAGIMRTSVQFIRDNYLFRSDFPAFKLGRFWKIKTHEAIKYMEEDNG